MRAYADLGFGLTLAVISVAAIAETETEAPEPEETMPTVVVEDEAMGESHEEVYLPEQLGTGVPADSAEALRNIPGVSAQRMGGHGLEPIIRGQSQNRLNILLDGAYIYGGCPNRMDPPTAYAAMDTYDHITVVKGVQTVKYGGGGSGGTVLFERRPPLLGPDKSVTGRVGLGVKTNSDTGEGSFDIAGGNERFYVRGIGAIADADNYEDGDGNETRTAYTARSAGITAGYTPNRQTELALDADFIREEDVLFAGAGMDSPQSDSDIYRLRFKSDTDYGAVSGIDAQIYQANVDHVMDNFSLRPAPMMKMEVPTESDTSGGRVGVDFDTGSWRWTLGVDAMRNERQATRFTGMTLDAVQSVLWPDVEIDQQGVFGEVEIPLATIHRAKAGIRYDRVEASADAANQSTDFTSDIGGSPVNTPNDLYQAYYGVDGDEQDEDNWGGFVRYEHSLGRYDRYVYGVVSRAMRTADATERYLGGNSASAIQRWIGNPGIEPEQHTQAEVGVDWGSSDWRVTASVYYDDVSDYILRDTARGQAGILQSDGASIYRNVEAELYGGELGGSVDLTDAWTVSATVAYVHGTNTDDDRPLPQIPPLEGTLGLDWQGRVFEWGGLVRMADRQDRVDLASRQDVRETPGWAVLDLYGVWHVDPAADVRFGVNNVFDVAYAYHVNRANVDPFNPEPIQVNEPGRVFWVKLAGRF
ncbi:MAG: TonB-dependent copper receptor [Pseudomonadota bacterium]|nr:TonB-dependent copper receptor [Pseudomonadota bacterium]